MLDKPEPAPSSHLRMFNRPGDEQELEYRSKFKIKQLKYFNVKKILGLG